MKIIYRYFNECTPWMEQFLAENGIKHTLSPIGDRALAAFTLPHTASGLISELAAHGITEIFRCPEFSKRELDGAQWLEIVKLRQIIDISPSVDSIEYSCTWRDDFGAERALHARQLGPLTIKKEPDISKTAFCSEDCGTAYLFTGEKVASLIKEHGLSGIVLKDVYYKNGAKSGSIFQVIPLGGIHLECIDTTGHSKYICKSCGKE